MVKVGYRKPSLKKSISARTSGRGNRALKRMVDPKYGKRGTGWIRNPRRAGYNYVYNRTTKSIGKSSKKARDTSSNGSSSNTAGLGCFAVILFIVLIPMVLLSSYCSSTHHKSRKNEIWKTSHVVVMPHTHHAVWRLPY